MGPHASRTLIPGAVLLMTLGASAAQLQETVPGFNSAVRPILARCLPCHGPDTDARKAQLELHYSAGATAPRKRGAAITPGSADTSSLIARVLSEDPELRMPPPGTGEPLSREEIDTLTRWIDGGAAFESHWSFSPPHSEIPNAGTAWAQRDLDRFVAAELESRGIEPSPPADRHTLARRASLDLLGIPPTPEAVDFFIADTRPHAYEHYVDSLLDSPAFGERWARIWLDIARYADTKGYEQDGNRTIWPWRDWVIRAFNQDMPFDQFTIEQLAGDLLPAASDHQILATGFHRNTMTNDEGGTRDEEFRMAAVIDRTNTTMEAWMGLSAGCAQCHDHKYDPISQEEYYQLLAFFNTTQDADRNDEAPVLAAIDEQARRKIRDFEAQREDLSKQIDAMADLLLEDPKSRRTEGRTELALLDDVLPPGATARGNSEEHPFPWRDETELLSPASGLRMREQKAARHQFQQHYFDDAATGASITLQQGDVLYGWAWIDPEDAPEEIMLQWHAQRGGWDHRAVWGTDAITLGTDGTPSKRRMGELPESGRWHRLTIDPELLDLHPGDVIDGVAFSQQSGRVFWDAAGVETDAPNRNLWSTDPVAWIAAVESVGGRGLPTTQREAVLAGSQRSQEQLESLQRYWATRKTRQGARRFRNELAQLDQLDASLAAMSTSAPRVPVMREQDAGSRRTTHVLESGNWRSPLQVVEPGTPDFLPSMPPGPAVDRLMLARWLVDPQNPLTARVQANRIWERFFGRGLVETQEDFGTQGKPPANQMLLDHLAQRFVELQWSWKALCREILTSATYQQSSRNREDLAEMDPDNLLLARGPRFRLEAEAIRDSALFASGRLDSTLYGPPVFPSQPPGIWQVTYNNSNWKAAEDGNRYRRALYTFWRRTSPYPAMTTFDAGSRETCMSRRIRTNTPLQALATLNDEPFIESAGGLAISAHAEAPEHQRGEITRAFRRALARPPEPRELEILEQLLIQETQRFHTRTQDALDLIAAARVEQTEGLLPEELAARIVVANVILNLDEFLVRD